MSLLRKMVPSDAMNGLWQRARLWSYPKKHRCPGCNRKMEEISVDAEGQTRAIDVCTSCQFMHVFLDPSSAIPCIGASGVISGVHAFYALRFRQNQLAVVFWFFFKTYLLRMSALPFFGIWVVLQLIVAGQQIMGISNVSGGAHLGGALAGVFVWLVWRFSQTARHTSEGSWSTK